MVTYKGGPIMPNLYTDTLDRLLASVERLANSAQWVDHLAADTHAGNLFSILIPFYSQKESA